MQYVLMDLKDNLMQDGPDIIYVMTKMYSE